MPTYEYACKQCGEHLDVVQRFTDDALTTCPSCAGSLRKVFGTIGISFKGSGFYKNDSRSSGNGTHQEKTEKPEKKDESSSSDKAGSTTTKAADGAASPSSDAAKPKKADAPTSAP
ncbi:MAG TPA: FmdB family zinc ribbon protein [Acidimicrobiales bacterium]|nr:FmdB family zinc ribbon protein [Acidimicrobiales bacterium]